MKQRSEAPCTGSEPAVEGGGILVSRRTERVDDGLILVQVDVDMKPAEFRNQDVEGLLGVRG